MRRKRPLAEDDPAGQLEAGDWPGYVATAERRNRAERSATALAREGQTLEPVSATVRSIATTFWGKAWCHHLYAYSDYESRLPRGRSYLRHGCVIDLRVTPGRIAAQVQGTYLYQVVVRVTPLEPDRWDRLKERTRGQVDSLLDLLAGKLAKPVMTLVTEPDHGLFPAPHEVRLSCTCPDDADLCKHAAAVLYGLGARLDERPELLFVLRGVDHGELVADAFGGGLAPDSDGSALAGVDLGALFGLDLEPEPEPN